MKFTEWYKQEKDEELNEEYTISDVDDVDDEWSLLVNPDEDGIDKDSEINERLIRKIVFRNGKRLIKFVSDKENYRVQKKNGRPIEVRMKPSEVLKRKKSQRIASKKRKSGIQRSILKRRKTLRKRTASGN